MAYAQSPLALKLATLVARQPDKDGIGISVVDLSDGQLLYEHRSEVSLKPASVLKIVTAYAALKKLGPEFKFSTRLLAQGRNGPIVEKLYIKGLGDPDFTVESMWLLVRQLKKLGINRAEKVIFDASAFIQKDQRSGQRAFETAPSALTFNFNSLAIEVCPGKLGQPAYVTADPWDLPIDVKGTVQTVKGDDFIVSIDEKPSPNGLAYTVRGKIGADETCRAVYRSIEDPAAYFAASFLAFAKAAGVQMPAAPSFGATPEDADLLHTFYSKALSLIVQDMNHFSTNFIGEQLLFALGANGSASMDREAGIQYLGATLEGLGFSAKEFQLADGSGLSHDNRLTPRIISKILKTAAEDASIRSEFEVSLSVAGRNGTLKKRTFSPAALVLRGKTGTINGVSSLAGYVNRKSGGRAAFVIFQNRSVSRDEALALEDQIVEAIYSTD